jgi:hypothetical protein
MVLNCGAIIAAVLFFVLPLIQYSLSTGQDFGNQRNAAGNQVIASYALNQPATDGNLQAAIVKTRDGAQSANGRTFLIVTTNLKNLRPDRPVHVAASDFTLIDSAGQQYLPYGMGDRIAQDIDPLISASYDLTYDIPQTAGSLKIRYLFPAPADTSGKTVLFLL